MDTERINSLLAWAETSDPNYPWMDRDFYKPLVEALGDNEEEIIQLIREADEEKQAWLASVIDELWNKFQSDAMHTALDELEKKVWP